MINTGYFYRIFNAKVQPDARCDIVKPDAAASLLFILRILRVRLSMYFSAHLLQPLLCDAQAVVNQFDLQTVADFSDFHSDFHFPVKPLHAVQERIFYDGLQDNLQGHQLADFLMVYLQVKIKRVPITVFLNLRIRSL